MALIANCRLLGDDRDRIVLDVYAMAAYTGNVFALVRTTLPPDAVAALVTTEADTVLLRHGRLRTGSKKRHRRLNIAGMNSLGVVPARPVAGFALQVGEGRPRIRRHSMLGAEDYRNSRIAVTGETGIRAFFRKRWCVRHRVFRIRVNMERSEHQQSREQEAYRHDQIVLSVQDSESSLHRMDYGDILNGSRPMADRTGFRGHRAGPNRGLGNSWIRSY